MFINQNNKDAIIKIFLKMYNYGKKYYFFFKIKIIYINFLKKLKYEK